MSKVYEAALQMQELAQDIAWNEHVEEMQRLAQEEDYGLSGENMEDCKAEKFAKMILEA